MRNRESNEPQEMTFWEHLDELRGSLFRSIIAVVVCAILAFVFKDILFDKILLGPKQPDFITYRLLCKLGTLLSISSLCVQPAQFQLINISLAGQFTTHMNIAMVAGLIIAMPYVLWELWKFIRPGLTQTEQRYTRGGVAVVTGLFFLGVLFSYFIVVPLMVNFLGGYQVSNLVINQVALTSYTSSITLMTLLMGLLFELPVLVVVLTRIGILTPKSLKKYRKHTIIVILIVAGVITPSPDIFSQLIVAIPLYALFESSLVVARRIYQKKQLAG